MTTWNSVNVHPPKPGKYHVKCGVSGETFSALWSTPDKVWTNLDGQKIVFGRPDCGDIWQEPPSLQQKTKRATLDGSLPTPHKNRKGQSPSSAQVKALREAVQASRSLGITAAQDWCAEALHTSRRTFQQWETGPTAMHQAFWELLLIKTEPVSQTS